MTTIDSIKDNPRQFRAFRSLNQAEFLSLLRFFAPICEKYYQYNDFKGDSRSMPRTKERSDSSLKGAVNKLLFILSYMKENATQAYHGALFEMSQGKVSLWAPAKSPVMIEARRISQGKVSMWIKQLVPLLEESLQKMRKRKHLLNPIFI